ncbi:MAG: hypothetical protein WCF68_21295 [Terriglobales bacterium]
MMIQLTKCGGKILTGRGKGKRFTWKGELRKVLKSQRTLVPTACLLVHMVQKEVGV